MNALRLLLIVWRKELLDGVRDRRAISTLLIGAVVTPLLIAFMFNTLAGNVRNAEELKIPVAGVEYAPAFIDWLKQQAGVEIVAAPADPEQAVKDRKEDFVLIIDKEFSKNMARAVPAPIKLVTDSTRDSARPKVTHLRALLGSYSGQMAALRLIARGVAPSLAAPVRVQDVEVSSAQERLAKLLNILPLLLVMAALTGGMQLAIDTTAGERERNSLEPLLLSPVPRLIFAMGKWLAASTFAWASVIFSMLLTVNVLRRVPWHDLGIRFRVTDPELLSLLALVLPLALFLSALVMFTSTFSRSYKEAQSYVGILVLIPTIPGVVNTMFSLSNRPYLAPIPVLGQYALAADLLGGRPPSIAMFLLAGSAVVACAAILVVATSRMLRREAIIFGR